MFIDDEINVPYPGIGVVLLNKSTNKVLISKRFDTNLWAFPGGWLEYGEEWEDCGAREIFEEIGLSLNSCEFKHLTTFNCYIPDSNYHTVCIYLFIEITDEQSSQIQNKEPHKHMNWEWVSFEFLLENFVNLFYTIRTLLINRNIKSIDDLKNLIK